MDFMILSGVQICNCLAAFVLPDLLIYTRPPPFTAYHESVYAGHCTLPPLLQSLPDFYVNLG